MFKVYILTSKQNGSYYIGSCRDVVKRLVLHNRGLVKSTKKYRPWQIVHTEEYENYKSARRRESEIKSWKKRSAVENLISFSEF